MQKSIFVTAILVLALLTGHAKAQGSSSSRAQTQGSGSSRVSPPASSQPNRGNPAVPTTPRPPTVNEFAASFWTFLNDPKKPYQKWGSTGKTKNQGGPKQAEAVAGQSDKFHREFGQTYLNDSANHNLQQLPLGAVLVREAYATDGKTIENITVMFRSKTADPKYGKWYWMMYQPDGSLATTSPEQGGRPIAGRRVQSCVQCHQQARGKDFVFLNDRPVPGAPKADPPGNVPGISPSNPSGSGSRR